ncbi:MAG TPA: hypothetical protein VGR72_12100 [Candidatus Acidoferrales bacterium]|nr:hypothetical protein [Candidatus Acidoferrales bacterium]
MSRRPTNRLITLLVVVLVIGVYLYRLRPRAGLQQGLFGCGIQCGVERWQIKTLTDADVASVNFSPRPSTVAWLTSQPTPSSLPTDSRIAPLEFQAFTVRALLVGYKEEDDRDFHLILADLSDPSATMIAEIPSAECSGACSSRYASSFESARRELGARFGMPANRFESPRGEVIVDVTGVAYFDFFHRQRGVAPNAIELHPVLSLRFE